MKKKQSYVQRLSFEEMDFLFSQLCRVEDFENTREEHKMLHNLKKKLSKIYK